ncbi:protein lin-37 homolog isoform X2 [Ambystoma mexicanum]|uniref:protein lin-37 homolog isoform X2 n=1 Tax=Ambystoma mexicanum TaxID=8296 RepID=UPI0037E7A3E9
MVQLAQLKQKSSLYNSHCRMLPVKVKIEKTELETGSARNRLDAVLQGLLEKNDVDREQMEDEAGKTASDSHSKESSPSAAGKRPSSRFPHHRRKKRKEMDDGMTDICQQKSNTYVIKLFDRSVDLAQFNENTPLYPICRAWMRNNPSVREEERCTSPVLPLLSEDDEGTEVINGAAQDVYRMPDPSPSPLNEAGEQQNLRIPSSDHEKEEPVNINMPPELMPTMSTLIYENMDRWKKIRQRSVGGKKLLIRTSCGTLRA